MGEGRERLSKHKRQNSTVTFKVRTHDAAMLAL
jgi:hypothetical protein